MPTGRTAVVRTWIIENASAAAVRCFFTIEGSGFYGGLIAAYSGLVLPDAVVEEDETMGVYVDGAITAGAVVTSAFGSLLAGVWS